MFYFIDNTELDQSSNPLSYIYIFCFPEKLSQLGLFPVVHDMSDVALLPHFIPEADQQLGFFVKLSKRNVQK